jgi:hypothetical protein
MPGFIGDMVSRYTYCRSYTYCAHCIMLVLTYGNVAADRRAMIIWDLLSNSKNILGVIV